MAWRYELREHNRLIEMRRGFETERLAQYAGERARGAVQNMNPREDVQIVVARDAEAGGERNRS